MSTLTTNEGHCLFKFGSLEYDLSSRTHIVGILNVTPDSFSDGGRHFGFDQAIRHAHQMAEECADIIDIGGESTRPGSESVSEEEELRRVIPVIQKLANELRIPLSIDTCKSHVAKQALDAGASIVNDISGFTADQSMPSVVANGRATVILMHMKGTPKTMQQKPTYDNVTLEVAQFLEDQVAIARSAGIDQIIVDPGIGFGKNLQHNLQIIRELKTLKRIGCPILVGPSRKSFIGTILDLPVEERLEGTAAVVTACILNGAQLVRVHDVKEMKRVASMADALRGS